jgi:hypothetical protein
MGPLSYPIALVAAGVNALSNVLQRAANRREPKELSMTPRLLFDLVRQPLWLAGFGTVIVSFVLVATALDLGRLAAVQPIIVLELPLTLLFASKAFHTTLSARERGAIAAMTAGVAAFVLSLDPAGGTHGTASALVWAVGIPATLVPIAALTLGALASKSTRRAALLGMTTGLTFGLTSAFMKGMTGAFHSGLVGVLTSWQTYAMAAAGLLAMYLLQNALHAGSLMAAQPGITLCDPVVGVLWGVFGFKETTRGGLFIVAAVASAAVIGISTLVLAHSAALAEARGRTEELGDRDRAAADDHGTGRMATSR